MIPRSTLKDTYDQIISDLDAGIADLPPTAITGKATSMAARALKSRAALFAARIAKYHPQSANGLTSIPASSAQAYYQMAHGAASAVIESGRHPLYQGGANLVDNFSEIFYKDVAEHIFVEQYNLSLGKIAGNSTTSHWSDMVSFACACINLPVKSFFDHLVCTMMMVPPGCNLCLGPDVYHS